MLQHPGWKKETYLPTHTHTRTLHILQIIEGFRLWLTLAYQ